MIVAKKSYSRNEYAYDNYAYDFQKQNNHVEEKKKDKRERAQKHGIKLKDRLKLITLVVLMFCIGILIVGRYALIMNLSNQCVTLKNKIVVNQKESDSLKLQLMKFYDIKQIEKDATSKLSMARPKGANTVNLSIHEREKSSKAESITAHVRIEGIINRIANFFN